MKKNNLESAVSLAFEDYPAPSPKKTVDSALVPRFDPECGQWVVAFLCGWAFLSWLMCPF